MTRALLATTLVAGLLLAGCGSDSSGETTEPTVSIPAITSPIPAATTTVPTATTTPTATGSTTTSTRGTGGSGPPGADPGKPDSETNDLPPPAGSPQDAFEKQCNQNPRACG